MKMKKWFVVIFLLVGTIAFAQTEADFTVELTKDGEGVVITDYTGTATAVRIPTTIQGMPVREIGGSEGRGRYMGAFMNNRIVTSVVIPEGVKIIRRRSFYHDYPGGDKLIQVTLPSTLQIIEIDSFSSNKSLKSIIIPNGVTEIGDRAFAYCISLASVTLPKSLVKLSAGAFEETAITSITLPPNLTRIAGETFSGCKNLISIVIPEGITEIGDDWPDGGGSGGGAFGRCIALTSVTLPSTIKKIGSKAFSGCSALTTITIPDTVEAIEMSNYYSSSPFNGCTKLTLASQARLKKVGYTGGF
jgi:hypothetical protein